MDTTMNSLVGVKSIGSKGLSKRELLLFDQIVVPVVEGLPLRGVNAQVQAALDWLQAHGLLRTLDLFECANVLLKADAQADAAQFLLSLLNVAAGSKNEGASEEDRSRFLHWGLNRLIDLSPRIVCRFIEQTAQIRSVPLVDDIRPFTLEAIRNSFPNMINNDHLQEVLRNLSPVVNEGVKLIQAKGAGIVNEWGHLLGEQDTSNNVDASPVMEIVLQTLPFPDESVPLEQLLEFRQDEQTRFYCVQLRDWMRKVATEVGDPRAIREELELSIEQYKDHMRYHKLRTQPGVLQTLIFVSAAIAENVTKLRWTDAAKALFTLRERQLALTEAERSAPGREVAYILKAREEFGG